MQRFPERMRHHQALQFGDHRVVLAQRQIGIDAVTQRDQPKLLEPRRLGVGEFRRAQIIEHRSPPQAQRLTEQARGALRLTNTHRLPAQLQQMLKLRGINLIGTNKQAIPGLPGHQSLLRTNAGQLAPKMRNMGPQGDIRARGRRPAPQRIGDPARRYGSIQIDQQQRKQLTLLTPTNLQPLPPVDTGGQRTQDAKPRFPGHGAAPPSTTSSAYPRRYHDVLAIDIRPPSPRCREPLV